jgi:hypothetical protein
MISTLQIGSLVIQTLAALDIEQSYEPLGGESILRAAAGNAIKQSTWKKTRITTSGRGWLPAGLESIDTTAQLVLSCVTPRMTPADFSTRQATLTAKRRSDAGHTPWGIALMSDGSAVDSDVVIVGDVATVAAVAGAVAYQVLYLPKFTVYANRPTDSGTRSSADYQWQLVCEEV